MLNIFRIAFVVYSDINLVFRTLFKEQYAIFDNLDVFKEALFYQTLLLRVKMFSMSTLTAFFLTFQILYVCVEK